MDPCEKEPTDALDNMVPQDREEITVDAQVTKVPLFISSVSRDGNNQICMVACVCVSGGVCSMTTIQGNKRRNGNCSPDLLSFCLYLLF